MARAIHHALAPSVFFDRAPIVRTPSIMAWMFLAIALVTALAFWDEERESRAALDDFAREQTTLARAIAASVDDADVARASRAIERPGNVRVLVARDSAMVDAEGHTVDSPPLAAALRNGDASVRLSRPEAAALGLPERMALAGIGRIDARASVLVVATARVERDREQRARWRLVLGVLVAAGLVIAFGGLAMRKQRKELELDHRLALSAVRAERDERLVRADKLATMGALATGVAHEVSTPLGIILGRAEQLLPKQSDERSRRAVETIAAQTERIDTVIRGFLALARGNKPSLERSAPAALAQAATELVEHRFEKAQVKLATDIDEPLPKVACDARLFEQVLVNLLINACDACREDGVVELSVSRADGDKVAFAVTDDGVGISADAVERVIEPFFTTKPAGKGSGLGLAIATEIVKHHRGTLVVEPRKGTRGTRAIVELPAVGEDGPHA